MLPLLIFISEKAWGPVLDFLMYLLVVMVEMEEVMYGTQRVLVEPGEILMGSLLLVVADLVFMEVGRRVLMLSLLQML